MQCSRAPNVFNQNDRCFQKYFLESAGPTVTVLRWRWMWRFLGFASGFHSPCLTWGYMHAVKSVFEGFIPTIPTLVATHKNTQIQNGMPEAILVIFVAHFGSNQKTSRQKTSKFQRLNHSRNLFQIIVKRVNEWNLPRAYWKPLWRANNNKFTRKIDSVIKHNYV